jgi:hypothetical protein
MPYRAFALDIGSDIAGQIRTDVGGVAQGVGYGNKIRGHAGRAEHGAVIFRKENQESGCPQQLSGSDAGAPGYFAAFRPGSFIQLAEMLLHDFLHFVGCLDFLECLRLGLFRFHSLAPVFIGFFLPDTSVPISKYGLPRAPMSNFFMKGSGFWLPPSNVTLSVFLTCVRSYRRAAGEEQRWQKRNRAVWRRLKGTIPTTGREPGN